MDLSTETESFGAEDQSWLGSAHGTDATDTITLDGAALAAVFTDGQVPSGVTLSRDATTGLYGPFAAGGEAPGHLFTSTRVLTKVGGTAINAGAALLWHGEVVVSKLPANHGLTAGAQAAISQIRYV